MKAANHSSNQAATSTDTVLPPDTTAATGALRAQAAAPSGGISNQVHAVLHGDAVP